MVNDGPPVTPTSPYDKVFQANAIKLRVHLDADKLNYSNWSELFKNHLEGFKVFNFIQPPTSPASTSTTPPAPTEDWLTADAIIKKWIYHTISEPLLKCVLKVKPKTSRDASEILENFFTDN
ncbi:hypothetical protein Tco_0352233 [Tanacetum coccineum]